MFLYEERRFFFRGATHTVVSDREPHFRDFCEDPGTTDLQLRIWTARPGDGMADAYVGAITLAEDGHFTRREVVRACRRLPGSRLERRAARRALLTDLRRYAEAESTRLRFKSGPCAGTPAATRL